MGPALLGVKLAGCPLCSFPSGTRLFKSLLNANSFQRPRASIIDDGIINVLLKSHDFGEETNLT